MPHNFLNKSLTTNLIAVGLVLCAVMAPEFAGRGIMLNVGLFALSGAITNWLAVYMLFEKIPLVYGSGVVPLRFEAFKSGIRTMIFDTFFSEENFERLKENSDFEIDALTQKIKNNFHADDIFNDLLSIMETSSLGSMLALIGGTAILEPLRETFCKEIDAKIPVWIERLNLPQIINEGIGYQKFRPRIETMVDAKLAELTPQKVKEMVSNIIREHLSWLVVWGGVFGGLLGAISGFAF